MIRRLHLILILYLSLIFPNFSQNETPILKVDELNVEDLKLNEHQFSNQKVVSASRSLQNLEDLPYTIYIITKEEIQQKGYNTLVDALKWIPGIRVSQPGSGLEGETFIMRGLQGNTYAKILINGIPVKPYATRGMPIGAQLPVREAERIEVIFGPAAAVYGADAAAGIINIVTRDSDRPFFTQAEIGLGSDQFSSLHVLLGGKLGKGKRILNYKVFGSFTSFKDRKLFRDTTLLFKPNLYDSNERYLNNPNYGFGNYSPTPHSSRLVGLEFKYKKVQFSLYDMIRRDHASIGLNPTAVSYFNPNNFIEDQISSLRFSWNPEWDKWGIKLNAGILFYKRNGTSSNTYVNNNLYKLFNHTINQISAGPVIAQQRNAEIYLRHFSGSRYSFADSFEPEVEILTFFKPRKEIEFLLGSRITVKTSDIIDYSDRPLVEPSVFNFSDSYQTEELSAFFQSYLNLKRIKGVLSVNFSFSNFYTRFNPRFAIQIPITKHLGIRGFYGTSFRRPSAFYYANTYNVWKDDFRNYYNGESSLSRNLVKEELQPESNTTIEVGFRWTKWRNIFFDLNYYYSKTDNAISFQELIPRNNILGQTPVDTTQFFTTGYVNFGDSYSATYGVQGNMSFKMKTLKSELQGKLGFNFSEGVKRLPGLNNFRLSGTSEQPGFSFQFQLGIPFGERWTLYLDNLYHTESLSDLAALDARETGNFDRETLVIPSYYTLDWLLRWKINRQFQVYLQILNLFNKEYGGLSATGTPDDLFYNAQSDRLWRIGMSYRLE